METKLTQEELYNLLTGRIVLAMNRSLTQKFRSHQIPLTKEQWTLLAVLWKRDGCSQQHLADQTFRDKPSVTRLLDKMEQEALIIRKADGHDRRLNLIFLTDKGRALEAPTLNAVEETVDKATKNLSDEQIALLKQTIKAIYLNLEMPS
ncbi:MarR family winged helix-turn-helix transcriptional regulator [Flavobacterium sp. JP2137]|uniref:MarR family winged helix-turn-helix transcriptional regulator n=1 Tax=Flavobacterium sp. JP2137 TaxID=3414510 RepID=UPI003D2FEA17